MPAEEIVISGEDLSTRKINQEIKTGLSENKKTFLIENSQKLDSIVVGLREESDFKLKGNFGDFIGALNHGAKIEILGDTGRYVGNNMTTGEIIVHGSAEDGVGFGTYNGNIVVHGNAGNAVGQLNKGGTIIVNGDIGDLAGLYMLSGEIIVTGNAGEDTGDWMIGGTIYVGGDFHTGTNAEVKTLENTDKEKLSQILQTYDIDTPIENFKKIEHQEIRPFYG
jgi:glutamate synthase domain-containing protein 3